MMLDENIKSVPSEITIIEKRPLRIRVLLGIGVAVLTILLVLSLVYILRELYNYWN